jgi:tyrosine-protein phosphatase SIW14
MRGEVMKMKRIVILACCIVTAVLEVPSTVAGGDSASAGRIPAVQLPASARFSEHIYGNLPGLSNVGRVTPWVYRGAQPAAEGYRTLKKMGVKTVINLRTSETEKEKVVAAGMRSVEVPMGMSTDNLREKVDRVVALMADPANQPVFVHCRQGRDRTGIVVAAYRMKVEGWSIAEAEAEMQAFGFNDIWVNFKWFIRRYGAQFTKR